MKISNGSENWRVLCELASKEKDPEKLLALITKINQALEDSRRHVDATSPSHRLADQTFRSSEHDC